MNDPLLLSRIQFGFTAGFHFLFPPVSIGLAWLLVIFEWLAWRRGGGHWEAAARFFAKVLGLTFAMGVATGIVLEFQFGMNWAAYSKFVGDIFGAPLAAEAVFAFFLESVFLGFYLFGRRRLSQGMIFFSILMVALGATLSAFWIIAANSWQQTPAGYEIRGGRAELVDFWAAVFNPSTLYRYAHTIWACLLCGAFFAAGCAAYILLGPRPAEMAPPALKVSLVFGLCAAVLVIFPSGHEHAVQVARTQPAKLAAFEGVYETRRGAPFTVFGVVRSDPPRLAARVDLPVRGLLSRLAFGEWEAEVKGLDAFAPEDRPPLAITFYAFHGMVALSGVFLAVLGWALLQLLRGRLAAARRTLRLICLTAPLPLAASELGWIAAEVGRQPWVVYGMLRTRDAVSPNLTAAEVWISLTAYAVVYALLGALYLFTLFHLLGKERGAAGGAA